MKSNNFVGLAVSAVAGIILAATYPVSASGSTITQNVVKVVTILIPIICLGGK